MKERPILFSGPMVRAIMAGKKTQTRRVIRLRAEIGVEPVVESQVLDPHEIVFRGTLGADVVRVPYAPGDQLWVRETFIIGHEDGNGGWSVLRPTGSTDRDGRVFYRATFNEPDPNEHGRMVWRSPYHMPRWASRLILEVTAVRVERLQDISEEDARAEGAPEDTGACEEIDGLPLNRRAWFATLWDTINGRRAPWASNPWCWVLSFRRVEAQEAAALTAQHIPEEP